MVMVAAIMPERRLHGAFPVIQPSTGAYLGPAHSRAWMMEDDKPERTDQYEPNQQRAVDTEAAQYMPDIAKRRRFADNQPM